jgi:hypothetical protein
MNNLAEELKNTKLRKASVAMKDSSDPKLAGFLTQPELNAYKSSVIECNFENWHHLLENCTFSTQLCPLDYDEAKLFVEIYERFVLNKDYVDLSNFDWRSCLNESEKNMLVCLESKLDKTIDEFKHSQIGIPAEFVFVKTSSRSAKDSPLATDRFQKLYLSFIEELKVNQRLEENEQITCLLKAAFECLKMRNAREVIDSFVSSERIYQDMTLALEKMSLENFKEHFVIRRFVQIDVDMEFRGFVFGGKLTALSQYNYLIYSPRLNDLKQSIQDKIQAYFNQVVAHKLADYSTENYVIDFAILKGNINVKT